MLFDSTLRRELARNLGATLVVIVTIVLTIMFIRNLGQAAVGRIAPQDVLLLLAFIALGHLPTMLALSLFVAVVSTLSRMYRGSEMTIWFASGVPLSRFVRPVLRTSWPVLLVIAALALFVWPWGNERIAELRDQFNRRSDLSRVAPGQFQTSADGERTFFFEGDPGDASSGRNVLVFGSRGGVDSVTSARSGRIETERDSRVIVLQQGQRNEQNRLNGDKTLFRFESFRSLAADRALATPGELPPKARRTVDLVREPTAAHQGELAWRLGLLLGACNLLLLGVGMSASNPRHAGNWNLLFALMGFFVYYNFINLTQSWVAGGRLGLGPALLIVHGGTFGLALALLWWREHSTARGLAPRRRRARRPRRPQPARRPT